MNRNLILFIVGFIAVLVVVQFILTAFFGMALGFGISWIAFGTEQMTDALVVFGLLIVGGVVLFLKPLPAMWNWVVAIGAFAGAMVFWMGWL